MNHHDDDDDDDGRGEARDGHTWVYNFHCLTMWACPSGHDDDDDDDRGEARDEYKDNYLATVTLEVVITRFAVKSQMS